MAPALKRGATYSAILHAVALLLMVLVIPPPTPPAPPPEDTMEVDFEGTAASAQKSQNRGTVASPAEADHPATENPALEKPKPQPLEKPPPPPPPPKAPAPQLVQTLQPLKIPPPPPMQEAEALKPPPPVKLPPQKQPEQTQEKPLDTVTHQPLHTKTPAPDTKSFLNTMEKLMADQKQDAPPTHRYNPDRGGVQNAGGQVHGNLTGALTEGQRKTIGDEVRRCYAEDTAAKDYASYATKMTVTVDAQGVARDVQLSPADLRRAGSDMAFRAFAERAEHAVLDPTCAQLPIPAGKLGKTAQLTFTFRP